MNQPMAAGTNRAFSHVNQTRAPANAVWRLWTDPSTWQDWDLGLKLASLDGPFEPGAVGTLTPKSGPESAFRITALEAGRFCAFVIALPLARLEITRTIRAVSPTVFEHHVAFKGPLAGLWAWLFGSGFRRDLPPTMARIAQIAEKAEAR